MQQINIYYGGRGLIEDPSIYVINKLTEVLEELNVHVERYNLYEDMQGISTLPKTLKEADGVILVSSVEWLGIGGLLQQFLDACWLYGDKNAMQSLYMLPVVTATAAGEKNAFQTLTNAWEILGGIPCDGICAYVADHTAFETSPAYALLIEKKAEDFYRAFTKKTCFFPSSTNAVCKTALHPKTMRLTPQESEQLSMYVSDANYVQKQKKDIEELTSMFQGMLGEEAPPSDTGSASSGHTVFADALRRHFQPITPLEVCYNLQFEDETVLSVKIQDDQLQCSQEPDSAANVLIRTTTAVMEQIIHGETTMHNAFLSGAIAARGDFKQLRTFDSVFPFLSSASQHA